MEELQEDSQKNQQREKVFFNNKKSFSYFREQRRSDHHHSYDHHYHSYQHYPNVISNDVTRYNRRDFAVELFTTVSEENIFPMVNLNGRQVMVLFLPWTILVTVVEIVVVVITRVMVIEMMSKRLRK